MKLELAKNNDAKRINDLLNSAYRGEQGWTTEYDVIAGERSDIGSIEALIEDKEASFLVYKQDDYVIACICLEQQATDVYIGSFAVDPANQSKGLGKAVLAAAEDYARESLGAERFVMVVLVYRKELIAYYERRGYQRTGVYKDFPLDANVGIPKVDDSRMEVLSKQAR